LSLTLFLFSLTLTRSLSPYSNKLGADDGSDPSPSGPLASNSLMDVTAIPTTQKQLRKMRKENEVRVRVRVRVRFKVRARVRVRVGCDSDIYYSETVEKEEKRE
jgi:hypothetical protein